MLYIDRSARHGCCSDGIDKRWCGAGVLIVKVIRNIHPIKTYVGRSICFPVNVMLCHMATLLCFNIYYTQCQVPISCGQDRSQGSGRSSCDITNAKRLTCLTIKWESEELEQQCYLSRDACCRKRS